VEPTVILYHPESDSVFFEGKESNIKHYLELSGCVPVDPSTFMADVTIPVGDGIATVLPDMDFETYSEAGMVYNEELKKWRPLPNAPQGKKGLPVIGAAAYSEHPTTEVLSLAYDLKDGLGARLWAPCMPPPTDLFDHVIRGGLIEAHNSSFEYHIWRNVCEARMGWPKLPHTQLRDSMAKCRAFSLPGGLDKLGPILATDTQKMGEGKRLLGKFSVPRNPTQGNASTRIRPEEDPTDGALLYEYNITDIKTEAEISASVPDLIPDELELWLLDQKINFRGVQLDTEARDNCDTIITQAIEKYTEELKHITGGAVKSANEAAKLIGWLAGRGVHMANMQAETVTTTLKRDDLPQDARRVLEIRDSLGSNSVKKLFAMGHQVTSNGRLKDLFAYCGADRTGRFAGRGPQPQNLPNSGPKVQKCPACNKHYGMQHVTNCPWCNSFIGGEDKEWGIEAVEDALEVIATRSLDAVEYYFGDAIGAVSGCLRGLFTSASGYDLLCSDYSAIEAVVLAQLAGEEWRLDVFRTHGKIYEMSASKITGVPFEEFELHKQETGDHHPLRKKIGKVAELASGYQGGLGAWRNFGADKHLSEPEIKDAIKAWRKESPMIVNFWYKIEEAAIMAIQQPGACFQYRGLTFGLKDGVLYCRLLSGRTLKYHDPILVPDVTPWGKEVFKITYMGIDSTTKKWVRLNTYGGKLTENIVQATARDLLTFAMVNLDKAGYNIVLHIHDEIVSEVPEGHGSVEEFEDIMATLPPWAEGWPVRAAGGWRGKRYRKD